MPAGYQPERQAYLNLAWRICSQASQGEQVDAHHGNVILADRVVIGRTPGLNFADERSWVSFGVTGW
ncbi:uncharacterized protein RAG0_03602 [Rhynchosporium agropyri]|uniref:Uncharacterized protein n=1 Tax=Rhynchosporium agropyri TaxID=914238 RepID=A0A1E1K561_9HELO|nr:uncharacterized protein RAG0_03602 [Rhynchosporium agropyri]